MLGWLWDIIKGLPHAAALEEKNRQLQTENESLKTELAVLKDEKRKLTGQVDSLTHTPDLHEKEKEILRFLFKKDDDRVLSRITEVIGFENSEESRFYLERLVERGFVNRPSSRSTPRRIPEWTLQQKGREYVVENNLLGDE